MTVRLSPPNSLLLMQDPDLGLPPANMAQGSVAHTDSSVAIGTLAEFDGETEVHLDSAANVSTDRALALAWEGALRTGGRLCVVTVQDEILCSAQADVVARVQVWTNDPSEPDLVWVALL